MLTRTTEMAPRAHPLLGRGGVAEILSLESLYEGSEWRYFNRGWTLVESDAGISLWRDGDELEGFVQGGEEYKVVLSRNGASVEGECSCPLITNRLCKHAVALGLRALGYPDESGASLTETDLEIVAPSLRATLLPLRPETMPTALKAMALAGANPLFVTSRALEMVAPSNIDPRRGYDEDWFFSALQALTEAISVGGQRSAALAVMQLAEGLCNEQKRRFTCALDPGPWVSNMVETAYGLLSLATEKGVEATLQCLASILAGQVALGLATDEHWLFDLLVKLSSAQRALLVTEFSELSKLSLVYDDESYSVCVQLERERFSAVRNARASEFAELLRSL